MKTGLVLARKVDEAIVIGHGPDAIEITVVRIQGERVRLHIAAPRSVHIARKEVASCSSSLHPSPSH